MAGGVIVRNLSRPKVAAYDVNGVTQGEVDGNNLVVELDRYDNGVCLYYAVLPFADYAGLEAEWVAGAAVTVLNAAVATWIAAGNFPAVADEPLTVYQRANIGYELAE